MSTPQQLPYSNPENIISAAPGAVFHRDGEKFSLEYNNTITELNLTKKSFANNYKNQVRFDSLTEELISFSTARESWVKTGTATGKTGWKYFSDKKQSLATEKLPDNLFLVWTDNEKYTSNVTNSYAVGMYYTGSYYSGSVNTFIVEISSSSPLWYYSSSAILTPVTGALNNKPSFGDTSLIGAPWEFGWTSTVGTSSLFGFVANFKFDGSPTISGSVDFVARMYLKNGFGASPVLVNGGKFTLVQNA
jgi:hypothetical protein